MTEPADELRATATRLTQPGASLGQPRETGPEPHAASRSAKVEHDAPTFKETPRSVEPQPTTPYDLRAQYAAAARTVRLRLGPNAIAMARRGEPIILNLSEADDLADVVLAVRDSEMQQLRRQLALVEGTARHAAENLNRRAEEAEAAIKRVRDAVPTEPRMKQGLPNDLSYDQGWHDAWDTALEALDGVQRPATPQLPLCPCIGAHFPSPTNCRWCKCHRTTNEWRSK